MPFVKGDNTYQKLGGRQGYEIEQAQLKKMSSELAAFVKLTERIRKGEATKEEKENYELISRPICKMMDKLHANKIMLSGDKENPLISPTPILNVVFCNERDTKDNKLVQKDPGGPGRNLSEQDSVDHLISDPQSSERQISNPDQHRIGIPAAPETRGDAGLLADLTSS